MVYEFILALMTKNISRRDNKNKMTAILVTTTGPRDQDWGDDDITPEKEEQLLFDEYNEGKLCPPIFNPPL